MNFPDLKTASAPMPDVQSSFDARNLAISQVGIRGVRYPVLLAREQGAPLPSIAECALSVGLPADQKGTHMSRFIELLEDMNRQGIALSAQSLDTLLQDMLTRLEARSGRIELEAPFFLSKAAPVSGVESLMDYRIRWIAEAVSPADHRISLQVKVPVKSLCPCSKEISDYGAHNQRSEVTVEVIVLPGQTPSPERLIKLIEAQASCELWGLLKRPDEKYVTERAYDNPKFVEDLVRDVAAAVKALPGVQSPFSVEAENFESIHNHSAWARLVI